MSYDKAIKYLAERPVTIDESIKLIADLFNKTVEVVRQDIKRLREAKKCRYQE
jgi:hypothetical protein